MNFQVNLPDTVSYDKETHDELISKSLTQPSASPRDRNAPNVCSRSPEEREKGRVARRSKGVASCKMTAKRSDAK